MVVFAISSWVKFFFILRFWLRFDISLNWKRLSLCGHEHCRPLPAIQFSSTQGTASPSYFEIDISRSVYTQWNFCCNRHSKKGYKTSEKQLHEMYKQFNYCKRTVAGAIICTHTQYALTSACKYWLHILYCYVLVGSLFIQMFAMHFSFGCISALGWDTGLDTFGFLP